MSRRRRITKKQILPDPKFNNVLASRFMNCLMKQGKKSVAEHIFYRAVDLISQRTSQPGIEVFQVAVEKVKPMVMVRSRRVGGATYQVPTEVRTERQLALALRWLIEAARSRKEKTMRDRIASELMDAANGRGGAVTKRENTHKMAEANKAFSHYRW